MDEREILTRFKAGTLGREQAERLLTGQAADVPAAPPQAASHTVPPQAERHLAAEGRYAVVGLAGRYPMAPDLHTFWENLREGRDTSCGTPAGRPGTSVLAAGQRGHLLDGVAEFDPEFFKLTPREGALMDPQERLFLETAWEALEDAGCTGARLDALTGPGDAPRAVGVFVGVSSADYALLAAEAWGRGQREMPAGGHGGLPGRLAALLGLSGPGQVLDTGACSALTAVHLAVASLERGECAAAVAGGVELLLHPSRARDGAGEGVGAVVLKRLDRALADKNRVYALIRATSSGFRPRSPASAAPDAAQNRRRNDDTSVATDTVPRQTRDAIVRRVGNAGAALGIAGITAAVLQVGQGVLAPVQDGQEAVPWKRECDERGRELPRSTTVEVDGEAGLVARAVVEEFLPERGAPRTDGAGRPELVLLSAPTPAHLAATAARLADWLAQFTQEANGTELADVARVLRAGRAAMPCRIALLAKDVPQLVAGLRRFARTRTGDEDLSPADLRDGGADPLRLGEAPETHDYLAALWRSGRLEQLTRLWLSGIDVGRAALEDRPGAPRAVPPPSAFLRRTLWLEPHRERAR
jgi:acyl transferase domain-containing protein